MQVTLHSSPRAANYYGTAISQCGQAESTYDVANLANPNYAYNDQGKHPLWDAGLTVCSSQCAVSLLENSAALQATVVLQRWS